MGYLGISLIFASVVLFCLRPPAWLPGYWRNLQRRRLDRPPERDLIEGPNEARRGNAPNGAHKGEEGKDGITPGGIATATGRSSKAEQDRLAMPPPPLIKRPVLVAPDDGTGEEEQTTPKAAATSRADPVPSFSLRTECDKHGHLCEGAAGIEPRGGSHGPSASTTDTKFARLHDPISGSVPQSSCPQPRSSRRIVADTTTHAFYQAAETVQAGRAHTWAFPPRLGADIL